MRMTLMPLCSGLLLSSHNFSSHPRFFLRSILEVGVLGMIGEVLVRYCSSNEVVVGLRTEWETAV